MSRIDWFDEYSRRRAASTVLGIFFFASIVYIAYAESYLSLSIQFVLGWSFVGLIVILSRVRVFQKIPLRFIFLLFAAAISFRYLIWRTFETLIYTGPFDLVGMTLLYLAEIYALTIHFLGMFVNIWPYSHNIAPLPSDQDEYPTVDIFIPTYNESEEIIKLTVTAATQIDYPGHKFTVHILDDGGTVAKRTAPATSAAAWQRHYMLKRMAHELGVNYITRERNVRAKAGNINHALQHTNGELVAILDCDHVVTRDFLRNTVGCFLRDKKLFLVQTPHFFINPAPVEKNLSDFSSLPGENDMFYKVIHPGLNSWNSSYFCGSAAVLRRSCLEEIGGISGQTITEDAETSFVLHGRGYNSVYIDKPMICGLSPDSFDDYIVQRTRWSKGMIQILMLKNPLFAKGLTLPQRLCYFNSCFFWLFGLSRIILYLAPTAFLIFGLKVYSASINQVLVFAVPHVIATFVVINFLYGRVRQPFFSEIYESVQSIFLVPAIISVILNPKKPSFEITPKGTRLARDFVSPLSMTVFLLAALNVAAIPIAAYKWVNYPLFRDVILVTFSWALFNSFLALASLGAFWERRQVRGNHRVPAEGTVEAFMAKAGMSMRGSIKDLSLSGMGIEFAESAQIGNGDELVIAVWDKGGERYDLRAKVRRYEQRDGKALCGVEFATDSETYKKIVRFVYGDSQRWADLWEARSRPKGTARELLRFLRLGLSVSKECLLNLNRSLVAETKKYGSLILGKAQIK